MERKVAVLVDSTSCLTKELVSQYGIRIVPINFYFGNKVYKDWVDITPDEAYQLFLKDPESFKTSGSNPWDWMEACREAIAETDNIVCITLSAKLSGIYNGVLEAREKLKPEFPKVSIEVVDSQVVTAAEGFIALAAARAAETGKSLAEVVKAAELMREKVTFLAFLDTIKHVYRTGRIPKIAAQVASVLNVRPLLTGSGGVVRFLGVVRSRQKGIERMLEIMRKRVGNAPAHVAVMHAFALEEAEKLKERIATEFNCAELWVTGFSPVMGYACGTGTLGIAFYKVD